MKRLFAAVIAASALALSGAGVMYADTSPNGPGQPGAPNTTCQQFTTTPGNAVNVNGTFNGTGTSSQHYAGNDGTASLANANSTLAVSQYDVACFQLTSHG